jgi:hypothetical protein
MGIMPANGTASAATAIDLSLLVQGLMLGAAM